MLLVYHCGYPSRLAVTAWPEVLRVNGIADFILSGDLIH
jgi:hypothetical protein